jgi:hypothetical protein
MGVVRWFNPEKRTSAVYPICSWLISCGAILASIVSASARGTISMICSPGATTPDGMHA